MSQLNPGAHIAGLMPLHVIPHVVPVSQAKLPGHDADGWTHIPVPLHIPGCERVLPLHDTDPHAVVPGAFVQALLPSQVPVFPHGGAAVQNDAGTGVAPLGRAWQAPVVAQV